MRVKLKTGLPRKYSIWMDNRATGCGWRSYLLVKEGRKFNTLLSLENGKTVKIKITEWNSMSKKPQEFDSRVQEERLRVVCRNMEKPSSAIQQAILLLEEMNK